MEVTSGEGGMVRMEGAEEAGILGFLGDGEGIIGVDGEGTIGVINVFCIVLLFCYITLDSNKDQAFQLLANCNFFLKYPKKCSKNYFFKPVLNQNVEIFVEFTLKMAQIGPKLICI